MKKIVYLNPDCFTDTDLTVLKHLAKQFDVVWYYIHESAKDNKLTEKEAEEYACTYGIKLKVVDPKVRNRSLKNIKFFFNIAAEINKINPDLVFHCERSPYWAFAIKLKLRCKNVILGIHDAKSHSYSLSVSKFLELATKDYTLHVHKYFATFSSGQKELFKKEYHKDSYMVGMSCKYFGDSSLIREDISKGVKLLFFGSINKYKGLDLLISALEQLRSEGIENITLTIAGRGSYWDVCKQLIKTQEMYNLQIRFVDNAEIPDLMSSHHFLVLPYRDATQSGPLATSVAYELPVIAPNFGCFSDTYSNESAFLYEPGNLMEALRKVSRMSEDQYEEMVKCCKDVKLRNSEEAIAENYVQYFNNVIDNQ